MVLVAAAKKECCPNRASATEVSGPGAGRLSDWLGSEESYAGGEAGLVYVGGVSVALG